MLCPVQSSNRVAVVMAFANSGSRRAAMMISKDRLDV
jgi:hypothetical protein